MSARRRIGLVGFGRWGRFILRDLLSLSCEVHVAVPSEASRQAASTSGAACTVADASALDRGLDGYVVAAPTNLHAQVIDQLLDRHRPIFVEKPMTDDPDSAERLVKAAGDRIFVMNKWCYHGGIEALAELARSGELGKVKYLQTIRCQCGQPHADVDATWILMPHDLSIVQHILGYLPALKAAYGERPRGILEAATAILGDSPQAMIQVSALWPSYSRMIRVLFEGGAASLLDPLDDHIVIHRFEDGKLLEKRREERTVDTEMPLLKELADFVNYLDGGPPPRSSAAHGAEVVRVIAEIHRLAECSSAT
jgi:predicted dehydrogenase